jgi:hypothetical protein
VPDKPPPLSPNHNAFAFLDSGRLAIADGKHPVRVVSAADGQVLQSFGEPLSTGGDRRLITSPDGRLMLIVPAQSPTVWDTRSGKAAGVLPTLEGAVYFAGAFMPDGRQLALLRSPPSGKASNNVVLTFTLGENGLDRRDEWPAPRNARSLVTAGKFIAVEDSQGVRIYAADTLDVVFDTSGDIRQSLVSLDVDDRSATLTTLHLGLTAPTLSARWKQFKPALLSYALPGGAPTPLDKFAFPEAEPNDHRFQAQYATSPDRQVFAASREGRVDFYRLSDGSLSRSIALGYEAHHPQMQFLSAQRVLMHTHFETDGINEFDLATGQKLATIPDSGLGIAASPDGRRFALRRNMVPLGDGSYREFSRTAIIIWERQR